MKMRQYMITVIVIFPTILLSLFLLENQMFSVHQKFKHLPLVLSGF